MTEIGAMAGSFIGLDHVRFRIPDENQYFFIIAEASLLVTSERNLYENFGFQFKLHRELIQSVEASQGHCRLQQLKLQFLLATHTSKKEKGL